MRRSRSHRIRFSLTIRINKLKGNELFIKNRLGFGNPQGVFQNLLDGSPDVDDLVTSAKESFCFGGETVCHSFRADFVGLVDVGSLDGTTQENGLLLVGLGLAALVM